jgi:pyruvate formate lyase activating enzyme
MAPVTGWPSFCSRARFNVGIAIIPKRSTCAFTAGYAFPGCPSKALTMTDGKVHWDESLCEQCDSCIKICPHLASPKILTMSSDDVIEKLKEVAPFVRGITVSGGECMMHPEFLEELFGKVKALNMTSLIDSNGFVRFEEYQGVDGRLRWGDAGC